jgi:transposase
MKLSGQDRNQIQMICLEGQVAPDSYARVIDAFVDFLEIGKLGFKIKGRINNGRPAFPEEGLLKLYFYGYINRVRSSRRLEREAKTNIEAMWLLRGLQPHYRTIAEFRAENAVAFKQVLKAFNQFLHGEGQFSEDTVATDGSKFRAQNSKKNNYNEKKINDHLNYIEKQTEQYLDEMDELDAIERRDEGCDEQVTDISEKLERLTERKKKYETLKAKIEEVHQQGVTQISTTDKDARALPKKMNIVEVGYNLVITAEDKNKLITNFETRNEHDTYALSDAALNAREALDQKEGEMLNQLADKGFDTGAELKRCIENEVQTYVSPKSRVHAGKDKRFNKEAFQYEEEKDVYICPEGKELKTNGRWYKKNNGKLRQPYKVRHYKLPFETCHACPFGRECAGEANLNNSKGRYIERSEYQCFIDENMERVMLNKELYRRRQEIVEHPFGTIKRQWGYDYTLLKGLEKVGGEFAIIFSMYNLRRAISIFGVQTLIEKLKKVSGSLNGPVRTCFKPLPAIFF